MYTRDEIVRKLDYNATRGIGRAKLGHNTYARYIENAAIAIKYHDTDVCIIDCNDTRQFFTGGWYTSTTKERINWFVPRGFFVYQERSVWYIRKGNYPNYQTWAFAEGLTIDCNGIVSGAMDTQAVKEIEDKRKRALKYCKDFIAALFDGEIGKDTRGDCFYCQMVTDDNKTLGEVINSDHIEMHIEEGYYVLSMLYRAIELYPVSQFALWILQDILNAKGIQVRNSGIAKEQLTSSLKKFVYSQLGLAR